MRKTITKIVPFIAIFFVLLEVISLNRIAGFGQVASSIDQKIVLLEEQNARLEQQVASESSLLVIEAKAKEFGFTEANKSSYIDLSVDLPLAHR